MTANFPRKMHKQLSNRINTREGLTSVIYINQGRCPCSPPHTHFLSQDKELSRYFDTRVRGDQLSNISDKWLELPPVARKGPGKSIRGLILWNSSNFQEIHKCFSQKQGFLFVFMCVGSI